MSEAQTDPLEAWVARQEIRDVLSRYCRGLDRMDKEMAYGVWHEGGTADYVGIYQGSGRGFVDWVWESHAAMACHSHQITNVLIELDGPDRAVSEAYVTVALWTKPDPAGKQVEIIARGRYLDRWSRREGRWAIDERTHLVDQQTTAPLRAGAVSETASRDPSDPSFALFSRGSR